MQTATDTAKTSATHDVLSSARGWVARDGKVALATVVDTWGSAPVPVGGQMAIAADGSFEGSVSGGCIEGEVLTEAEEILESGKPGTLEFGIADETAWSVGLPCGGRIKVFVERLEKDKGGLALLDKAVAARKDRKGLVLRTRLEDGRRQVFERGDKNLPTDVSARFWTGQSNLEATPEGDVFVHALVPPARILAIGATHITQLLSQIARIAGYEIIVIDPRTAFAAPERFPDITVVPEWPQDALPRLGLDNYTALAVLAHVQHIDDEALKAALRSECLYIGALGSSRNHAKRRERLKEAGFTDAELARIKAPIGIDISAQAPAEIAVSVMAEIIRAVRSPKAPKAA
ncbi:MAG: XdhC family protein [Hyphomicrobiaceae bacterium]